MDTWNPIVEVDPRTAKRIQSQDEALRERFKCIGDAGPAIKQLAEAFANAFNPRQKVGDEPLYSQVEQAVRELEEEVMEEMQYYADLPEMLKEQAE